MNTRHSPSSNRRPPPEPTFAFSLSQFGSVFFILAWRNLWRHRRRTIISLLSIAFGFALVVFTIALADSSHTSMIRNAISLGNGHLTVQHPDRILNRDNHKIIPNGMKVYDRLETLNLPGRIDPRISLDVLASTAHHSAGVSLEGLQWATDQRRRLWEESLVEGTSDPKEPNGLVIGAELAKKLKVGLNKKIILLAGTREGQTQAHLGRVKGIYQTNLREVDSYFVFSNLDFAKDFISESSDSKPNASQTAEELQPNGKSPEQHASPLTLIGIFLDDPDLVGEWKEIISTNIEAQTQVYQWQEIMPELLQFIWADDLGNYIFMAIIAAMLMIGVFNTVLMGVLERTREFGLLRALGMSPTSLMLLVVGETFLLAVVALFLSWVAAAGMHLWFYHHGIDITGMTGENAMIAGTYMDPIIRTELSWERVLQLSIGIFLLTLISGIWPAIKAARITPIEALRT